MGKNHSACLSSEWTNASQTICSSAAQFYGLILRGSAAATAVAIKDGTKAVMTLFADITAHNSVILTVPIQCSTNITATNGGTGQYTVLYAPNS